MNSGMALCNHREPNLLLTYQSGAILAAELLGLVDKVNVQKRGVKFSINLSKVKIALIKKLDINIVIPNIIAHINHMYTKIE